MKTALPTTLEDSVPNNARHVRLFTALTKSKVRQQFIRLRHLAWPPHRKIRTVLSAAGSLANKCEGDPIPLARTARSYTMNRIIASQGTNHQCCAGQSELSFQNVSFVVQAKGQERHILRNVSGACQRGHVLAIMGPSGAGKSSLIGALTLTAVRGELFGSVTLNNMPLTDKVFKEHCYVVPQYDRHFPYLTCRETLRFAAELYNIVPEQVDAAVDRVIETLGLRNCANTRNGRLSGGQARRLSIGMALLKQPAVLFLDEPTTGTCCAHDRHSQRRRTCSRSLFLTVSDTHLTWYAGLDAAAAGNIMQEIVRVANAENIIILCTIHQPSTKVYNRFDELMILSRGRTAYIGPVKDAVSYFDNIGYPLPVHTNPAGETTLATVKRKCSCTLAHIEPRARCYQNTFLI
jgi:ABC-type multidrug transport system ATPase subunit